MPLSVIIAILAVSLALPLFLWSVLPRRNPEDRLIKENLSRGLPPREQDTVAGVGQLTTVAQRFTSKKGVARLDRLLVRAGRPAAWPLTRLVAAKSLLAAIATVFGFLLLSGQLSAILIVLVVVTATVAYFVPDLLLYSRGIERQRAIGLELPDTLDQMMIAVEAGLGFDAAMAHVGKNGKGPLAEELIRTLQDMRVGRSRREAYEELGKRTSVPDLNTFIRAIIQADIYGISISKVLRTQSNEMRLKRSQRAEEKAMQIPVKVMIPLILCILPVLFLVLLGPAVLTVMDTMG